MGENKNRYPKKTRTVTLFLLFGAALFNYADRYMLGILIPDIKAEMNLSDTQIGLLTGLAFTLFYATLGIPIARLADRYSRKTIIALALAVWSLMTAACGLAQNFFQLLTARVLVGVGEAGCTPPSHSIAADTFVKGERSRALATIALGSPAGLLLGFLIGGWLTDWYGWRVALFAFGLPGFFFAFLIYAKLQEPDRLQTDSLEGKDLNLPFWQVFRHLLSKPAFRHCVLGTSIHAIVYLGVITWLPSFFVRVHDMSIGVTGTWLALVLGFSQLAGIYLGGILGDRFGSKDERWYLWIAGYSILMGTPFFFIVYLWSSPVFAFLALSIPFFLGVVQAGPTYTVIQGIAGVRNRAMGSAINILIINIIGGGIGPQLVGVLSDVLAPYLGQSSLQISLLTVSIVFSIWSWVHFMIAAKTVRSDMADESA